MKLTLHSAGLVLFFIFFIVFSSGIDARPLTTEQGQNRELDVVVSGKGFESSKELVEMEDCNVGDEECLMRRVTLEAHLDYIYTQHHKP